MSADLLRELFDEGTKRFKSGDNYGAIALWVHLLEVIDSSNSVEQERLAEYRVILLINSGAALRACGEISSALNAYSRAQQLLLESESLVTRGDLDPLRASLHLNIGNLMDQIGQPLKAVLAWEIAWSFFSSDSLRNRSEHDLDRARMQSDLGAAFRKLGESERAFSAFDIAEEIMGRPSLGSGPIDRLEAFLLV